MVDKVEFCLWCGKKLHRKSPKAKYCNENCSTKYRFHGDKSLKEYYKPKKCFVCGKIYRYEDLPNNLKRNFSHSKTCMSKDCIKKLGYFLDEEWRKTEKGQKYMERKRKNRRRALNLFRERIRLRIRKKLGNKCCICGFSEVLDIHHLNHKRDGNTITDELSKALKKSDLSNYVVLCPNHHALIHRKNLSFDELKKRYSKPKSKE